MKTTKFYNGHRWTMVELSRLMELWQDGTPQRDIATQLETTPGAIRHVVQRLRTGGVPLTRRTKGNVAGRSQRPWTQGEVEYLMRRRADKAVNEEIGIELGRSESAVGGMVRKLRSEQVPIAMRGNGVRRLYDPERLKALAIQMPNIADIQRD